LTTPHQPRCSSKRFWCPCSGSHRASVYNPARLPESHVRGNERIKPANPAATGADQIRSTGWLWRNAYRWKYEARSPTCIRRRRSGHRAVPSSNRSSCACTNPAAVNKINQTDLPLLRTPRPMRTDSPHWISIRCPPLRRSRSRHRDFEQLLRSPSSAALRAARATSYHYAAVNSPACNGSLGERRWAHQV